MAALPPTHLSTQAPAGRDHTARQPGQRMHPQAALLGGVAKEPPPLCAPAVHRHALRARHRHVCSVLADSGMQLQQASRRGPLR